MPTYPEPTPIYHFTHIDNLSDLIKSGAILCKNEMSKRNNSYTSSASGSVQSYRHVHTVPVPPGGTIHDYVPFYFNSLSPMLYTIKCGNIDDIKMQDLVFFKSTAQIVEASGSKFAFTDGHGIMDLSDYYNAISKLDQISWNVIHARYWGDYPDGKRIRQSEFLVHKEFNWNLVELIGVYNADMHNVVKNMVSKLTHQPSIQIKQDWFF